MSGVTAFVSHLSSAKRGLASRAVLGLLLSMLASLAMTSSASAITYNVAADFTAIQNAINAASPGDRIVVAAGTATLGQADIITIPNTKLGIELVGAGIGQTVLEKDTGSAIQPILWVGGATPATPFPKTRIEGFTIRDTGDSLVGIRIGAQGPSASDPDIIRNCDIRGFNSAGIYLITGSLHWEISGCTLDGDYSSINLNGADSLAIRDNVFGNYVRGIYQSASLVTTDMIVEHNEFLGGTWCMNVAAASATNDAPKNWLISENCFLNSSYGLYIQPATTASLSNVSVKYNHFANLTAAGGDISNASTKTLVASGNYWGSPSGPTAGDIGNPGNTVTTPYLTTISYAGSASFESGESVVLAAHVADSSGPNTGVPVSFYIDGVLAGTASALGGTATFDAGPIAAGTYSVTAQAAGDCGAFVAGPATLEVTVAPPVATTTTVVSSKNPSTESNMLTFTAFVNPSDAMGLVTFYDGTEEIGVGSVLGGSASIDTNALVAGSHTIRAVYAGDGTHAGSYGEVEQLVYAYPAIAVDKVTQDGGSYVDGAEILSGESISWRYVVSNLGGVPLHVDVTDDMVGPVFYESGDGDLDGWMDTDEVWYFSASGTSVGGDYVNVGTATGTSEDGITVADSDSSAYLGLVEGVSISTQTNGVDFAAVTAGDALTWTYEVVNTGTAGLWNVIVADDQGVVPVYMSGDLNGNGALDAGETWTYSATGMAVEGTHSNTATVSGGAGDWAGHERLAEASDDTGYVAAPVPPANHHPVAADDYWSADVDTPVEILADDLMSNDADPDGDWPLEIIAVAPLTPGASVQLAGATITFTPAPGQTGEQAFEYTVTDGHGGYDQARVAVTVSVPHPPSGVLNGVVRDATTGLPLEGATVRVGTVTAVSDAAGAYTFPDLVPGTYTVECSKAGYALASAQVTVVDEGTEVHDFALHPEAPPEVVSTPASSVWSILLLAAAAGVLLVRRRLQTA